VHCEATARGLDEDPAHGRRFISLATALFVVALLASTTGSADAKTSKKPRKTTLDLSSGEMLEQVDPTEYAPGAFDHIPERKMPEQPRVRARAVKSDIKYVKCQVWTRAFHLSTFQLNLEPSCQWNPLKLPNVSHKRCSRHAGKWRSVARAR